MDFSASAQTGVNLIFIWIGFGIVVGMVAKVFLPEGEPKDVFGILVVGVSGSCAGPLLIKSLFQLDRFQPISPLGFAISVLASLVILLLYRSLHVLWKRSEAISEDSGHGSPKQSKSQ